MTSWLKAKFGRIRVSTAVLIIAFLALFWVHENVKPEPAGNVAPAPAVVPPGFVPDPNYTWVPRTNVRRPKEPETTTDDHHDHQPDRDHVDQPDPDHHPDDDGDGSGRSRSAGTADADGHADDDTDRNDLGDVVADAYSDDHGSAQLARRSSPATLARRDDHP